MYAIKKGHSSRALWFGGAHEYGAHLEAELVPFVIMQMVWKRRQRISGPEIGNCSRWHAVNHGAHHS
jgi:hypothetical protein